MCVVTTKLLNVPPTHLRTQHCHSFQDPHVATRSARPYRIRRERLDTYKDGNDEVNAVVVERDGQIIDGRAPVDVFILVISNSVPLGDLGFNDKRIVQDKRKRQRDANAFAQACQSVEGDARSEEAFVVPQPFWNVLVHVSQAAQQREERAQQVRLTARPTNDFDPDRMRSEQDRAESREYVDVAQGKAWYTLYEQRLGECHGENRVDSVKDYADGVIRGDRVCHDDSEGG